MKQRVGLGWSDLNSTPTFLCFFLSHSITDNPPQMSVILLGIKSYFGEFRWRIPDTQENSNSVLKHSFEILEDNTHPRMQRWADKLPREMVWKAEQSQWHNSLLPFKCKVCLRLTAGHQTLRQP